MLDAGVPVSVVVADRPCRGLEVAERARVEAVLVDRGSHGGFGSGFDRPGYTSRLTGVLTARAPDLIAMAGFGTVLDGSLFEAFGDRVLNTHPALLPAHKGWHAVAEALAAGDRVTGCTVHVATAEMDSGPVLAQESVEILPGDTEESLHERIKAVERVLYPATVLRVLDELGARTGPAVAAS
jgi:phosphoribosylglycinamide formyltransferase-1